jgi:hypothetical protein
MNRSQQVSADVTALLRARNPLIWVVTREEGRAESHLIEASAAAGYVPTMWDVAAGFTAMDGASIDSDMTDPGTALRWIDSRSRGSRRGVWIMRDLAPWLDGPIGLTTVRQLRNFARNVVKVGRDNAQAIIVLSPSSAVPAELSNHCTVIEWPLPDRAEISAMFDAAIEALPDEMQAAATPDREGAIDAAVGLSGEEAQATFAYSLVKRRVIDPLIVAGEKRRVISREGVLEWVEPLKGGLDAVGGLDVLKSWLVSRRAAFSVAAREYGLPAPRGALLVGVPGSGKSLTAKAVASAWGVPLLRLDLNGLKGGLVGESEANLRRSLRVIEAIGRCVVWLDELEKALAGSTQGASDGGVSADALGTVLSWMQERQGEAFVIATANDPTKLPPELMRKGRFDDVWFVDVPTAFERGDILATTLLRYQRGGSLVDIPSVVAATEGFTGVEVAELVPSAMYLGFADGRDIVTSDLIYAAQQVVPLTKTSADKIEALRAWGAGRARRATSQGRAPLAAAASRDLDF